MSFVCKVQTHDSAQQTLNERLRADFPILHQEVNGKQLVYLDNGATSQTPTAVTSAISDYYDRYAACTGSSRSAGFSCCAGLSTTHCAQQHELERPCYWRSELYSFPPTGTTKELHLRYNFNSA